MMGECRHMDKWGGQCPSGHAGQCAQAGAASWRQVSGRMGACQQVAHADMEGCSDV